MQNEGNELIIPFNRAVRVGNFKVWRSRVSLGSGKDKTSIEAVSVSNLDGSWKVQIPSTSQMFGFIMQQYATVLLIDDDSVDDNQRLSIDIQ